MKQAIKYPAAFMLLAAAAGALAHGALHPPKYGGIVAAAKDVEYEFVAKADSIAVYVEDHGKPVETKGGTAKLTLLSGAEKTVVILQPAGANKLEAKGAFKVTAGTKAVTVVTLPGKPAASARFEVK